MFFKKKKKQLAKLTIGAIEHVSLPELGIKTLQAKVDTGAKYSVLHAENIKIKKKDNKKIVYFDIMLGDWNGFTAVPAQAPLLGIKKVYSSNGQFTRRPVIETEVALGNQSWKIKLSLTNRSSMQYRMLLGRLAIKNRFIVDVSKRFVQD